MVAAGLVAERQLPCQRRHSVGLVQLHRFDCLSIRPTLEQPRLHGPDRRLDLQVGPAKRAHGSVVGHEGEVVVPSDPQVDRALLHPPRGSEPSCCTCSGFVNTSKTSAIGASNSRVMTISSSFGNSMTADPCRLGVTAFSLSLELFEVVLDPIQSVVDRPLVLGHPVVHGPKARGVQAVEPATALRPAPDEPHLTEHPQVLRDLGLRHREVAHDRPDRLLACDQHVEDLAAVDVADRVEDIRRRRGAGHVANIFRYGICQACDPLFPPTCTPGRTAARLSSAAPVTWLPCAGTGSCTRSRSACGSSRRSAS